MLQVELLDLLGLASSQLLVVTSLLLECILKTEQSNWFR